MSRCVPQIELEDLTDIDLTLMALRKPTELKKVIDSVPKPLRAVPKYGLPLWYKLGLECKLPVPKMPAGKIIFSRGKIGEDVRRVGLGTGGVKRQTFDLTDPYCNNVSYDYVAVHDPHLAHHFSQKPARQRMQSLGFCTADGRAICTLKEFNQYRKYLYNQFMDRIHMAINELDERARDDLTLKHVNADVERRRRIFIKAEKTREHLEWIAREHAEGWMAKRRAAKEQEKKIKQRMILLAEFNRKQREERAIKAADAQNRIKQRVHAAAEIELRRKITMVRLWRANEKKRMERLKAEREKKQKQKEDQANEKWRARVKAQNAKIQEEQLLLRLYSEDLAAAAARRSKKAAISTYNTDLVQQQIRFANWRAAHGAAAKVTKAVRKMGYEFAKSKRGSKGMNNEVAQAMASDAMAIAASTKGDALMTFGQARIMMDTVTVLPKAPVKILADVLENVIIEFARRRVHQLLRDVEYAEYSRAAVVFFRNFRPQPKKKGRTSHQQRWSFHFAQDLKKQLERVHGSIVFGAADTIPPPKDSGDENIVYKSIKDRPPTPVPSLTKLAEVTFGDRLEDLPEPVTHGSYLPERAKLLEMVNISAKLLSKSVSVRVEKGMNVETGKVTLPKFSKHPMEWGEAVESLANAVVDNRIQPDSADIRHTAEFLTHRILKSLLKEMKHEKAMKKLNADAGSSEDNNRIEYRERDFYEPDKEKDNEAEDTEQK